MKSIEEIVKNIYNKLGDIKYTKGEWFIIDDLLYKKINNKITLKCVNNIALNSNKELVCLVESKDKYYFIKWNGKFISVIESETEYGLAINDVNIFAINSMSLLGQPNKKDYNVEDILKIIGFKLSKKLKLDFKYFT